MVNVLKRVCEVGLVVAWATLDQAMGAYEVGLALVLEASPQLPRLFEIAEAA
ncbi:MAG: hypothetical protein NVS4B11_39930 [Ktedonobacteraceae bacterium]